MAEPIKQPSAKDGITEVPDSAHDEIELEEIPVEPISGFEIPEEVNELLNQYVELKDEVEYLENA